MNNYRIVAGAVGSGVLASLFAGGYATKAVNDSNKQGPADTTCSNGLRQAMDDMHTEMHRVKASGNVDEDFVRMMLPHHQGAIDMAKVEVLCGKDEINRRLAQEIIVEQQSEIELMRLWLSKRDSKNRPSHSDRKSEHKMP